ncbi:MAG: hypothetical protein DRP85_06045 [Candidatus Makaraimicrobium thalassicum]|nr:MAG: hypothetical protein DRP85_06045 [Candidatus Omnitrophota bacterium]
MKEVKNNGPKKNAKNAMKSLIFHLRICLPPCVLLAALSFHAPVYPQSAEKRPVFLSRDIKELAKNIFASCELFEEGKKLYQQHDYANAGIKFQQALARDPKNKKARKYLKLCNRRTVGTPKKTEKGKEQRELDERKRRETETRFLQELEQRVKQLEIEQRTAVEKEAAVSKKMETTGDTRTGEQRDAQRPPRKEISEFETKAEKEKRIKNAEYLIKEGDKYYEQLKYQKAYKLYKEAFQALQSSD